jgi:CoA:oxalate CoA-transferase
MAYPLEGLRVLDLSRFLAGPYAGRMLCDLGADVVKVEPLDGDTTRIWGADVGGTRGYYHQQNAGKRNICIDLRMPAGVDLLKALAAKADVLIENFRPGVTRRLGISYADLRAVNPRLVMLSISGFGQEGPESQRMAFASVIHAESGLIARQAKRSGSPLTDIDVSQADMNAGMHGLIGVLSALWMREKTGLGQHIDIAMIDATLGTDDFLQYALEDSWETRATPSEVWSTAGGPILISADVRHIWNQLRAFFGLEDPAPAGATVAEKAAARREAIRRFLAGLPGRTAVIEALNRMNLAWGDVRESEKAREQPTVAHRRTIVDVDDRAGGTRPIVQSPYRFSAAESGVRGPVRFQGEDNETVLREWLGADEGRMAGWRDALLTG